MAFIALSASSGLPVWFLCWDSSCLVIAKVGPNALTAKLSVFVLRAQPAISKWTQVHWIRPWLQFLAEAQSSTTFPTHAHPLSICITIVLEAQFFLLLLLQAVPASTTPRTPVWSGRALILRGQNQSWLWGGVETLEIQRGKFITSLSWVQAGATSREQDESTLPPRGDTP